VPSYFVSCKATAIAHTLKKIKRGAKTVNIQCMLRLFPPPKVDKSVPSDTVKKESGPTGSPLSDSELMTLMKRETQYKNTLALTQSKLGILDGLQAMPAIQEGSFIISGWEPAGYARYEPHRIPMRVLNPRNKLYKSVKWLTSSKRGIGFAGSPTLAFGRFLRNVYTGYANILRLCQTITCKRDYNVANKLYHDLRRLLSSFGVARSSDNVMRCLKVIGMSLRFAKKEHCSRATV